MTFAGPNIDPLNPHGRPSAETLLALGATAVRLVSRPDCEVYAATLRQMGLLVFAVIGRESQGYVMHEADALIVGNEMDLSSPSSWTMTPEAYADLWHHVSSQAHGRPRLIGGLASGDLDKAEAYATVATSAAAFSLHPYGQRPLPDWPSPDWGFSYVGDLILRYCERPALRSLPLLIGEYGCNHHEQDEAFQAEYLSRMTRTLLDHPLVLGAFQFCWSDGMVDGFGLLRYDGSPKPAYTAYQEALTMPEFRLGFKDLADYLGQQTVGEPEHDERTLRNPDGSQVLTVQSTTRGLMVYCEGGQPAFLPGLKVGS